MFRLRKLQPPFGTEDSPQYEPTYNEGMVPVVGGVCEVRTPESRDRLIKLGYEEIQEPPAGAGGRSRKGR